MTTTEPAAPTGEDSPENDGDGPKPSDADGPKPSEGDVPKPSDADAPTVSRRAALRAIGGGVAAGTALGATPSAAQAQSDGTDLESWFENTSNFDGVEDRTGSDAVTVEVGVEANDGAFGFGPAAIRVTPGTTVTWEWTGKGGSHNVAHTDGNFESELVDSEGHTFSHTFEETGTYTYVCTPHETMGMKGAVVVSEGGGGGDGGGGESGTGDIAAPFQDPGARSLGGLALGVVFGLALASPGLFGAFLWFTDRGSESASPAGEE